MVVDPVQIHIAMDGGRNVPNAARKPVLRRRQDARMFEGRYPYLALTGCGGMMQQQIIGLGGAGGPNDLVSLNAKARGQTLARLAQRAIGSGSESVRTRGIGRKTIHCLQPHPARRFAHG